MSIRASKQAAMRGRDEASLPDAMARQSGYPAWVDGLASEDAREGPRAFAEARSGVKGALRPHRDPPADAPYSSIGVMPGSPLAMARR